MAKLLLIEDNRDLVEMLLDWLRKFEHFEVECAYTGSEGLSLLKHYGYDLAVIDWDVPEVDGISICTQIRALGLNIPILMLTGKQAIEDKETGFNAGADDYLTKPFHMKELSVRLRALLRRSSTTSAAANVLVVGPLQLCTLTHQVTNNGDRLLLLPKEFALLEFLMRHPNQVYSAEALLNHVWSSHSDSSIDALRVCMMRLRRKLDSTNHEALIRTVHGVGYKLEV